MKRVRRRSAELVEGKQFALDILGWPPLTDIDELMANTDDITNSLIRLTA